MSSTYNSDYRYTIEEDGTISRGRIVRNGDWADTSDDWRNYWDGDGMVGFTVHYRGTADVEPLHDDDDNQRAVAAYYAARRAERGADDALDTVARRITGNEESRFVSVSLDRGTEFYALAWGGDPDNTWRDEIECVWYGDVFRIEADTWHPNPDSTMGGGMWLRADSDCEEYYGEDNALAELRKQFDLDEFPADKVLPGMGD